MRTMEFKSWASVATGWSERPVEVNRSDDGEEVVLERGVGSSHFNLTLRNDEARRVAETMLRLLDEPGGAA